MRIDHFLSNAHGKFAFSAADKPALQIEPGTGETIGFETTEAMYVEIYEGRLRHRKDAKVNPVTGPVYVRGAEVGDALRVEIVDIALIERGWSIYLPSAGALSERMDAPFARPIAIIDGMAHLTERYAAPIRPMIGCIGTAPATGANSTLMPSYATGGNMDLTDAAPGNVVYLPVEVPGAYLSIGDFHAIMARGESSFVAIETQGTAVVRVDVVKNMPLRAPRIETPHEWCFVGIGDPIQTSIRRGYEDCFDFMVSQGITREDAYVLMSAEVHSELGGPTGSRTPDVLHPYVPRGAVSVHRLPKAILAAHR
ncbi:MAG: acetamidase/formamidase family protein [Bowdeniella nasicola]|nr:acetamidase/formamidase family protein [Bowdeniella nasicola]